MGDILNKITLPKGAKNRTKMDLSATHLLTTQFGQLDVITNIDVVPSDLITCNVSGFGRVVPMLAPSFGSARVALKAFFVPYNKVWKYFDDWQNGKLNLFQNPLEVPQLPIGSFIEALIKPQGSQGYLNGVLSTVVTDNSHDFLLGTTKYKLTPRGKYIVKLLDQLGYKLPFGNQNAYDYSVCALSLLSFFKAYVDYIMPNVLRDNSPVSSLLDTIYRSYRTSVTPSDLVKLFDFLLLPYDMDYFTASWDSVNGPRNANTSGTAYNVPNSGISSNASAQVSIAQTNGQFASPVINLSTSGTFNGVTDQMLRNLLAFRNFMMRNGVVGSRAIDKLYSRFGVVAPDAYFDRCDYLGKHYIDLHIADIKNTSSSGGATLGSFAGQGYIGNDADANTTFRCKSYSYGKFFVLGSIMPHTLYYQGMDRINLAFSRSDFFTPEYDQLGNEPVAYGEFFVPYTKNDTSTSIPNLTSVFGYMPRYAGVYKMPKSRITGEYIETLKEFQMGRDVRSLANNGAKAQSDGVLFHTPNDTQYNRVFADTTANSDKFLMSYNFGITAVRPMCSLYDSLGITGGADVNINNQGMIIDN